MFFLFARWDMFVPWRVIGIVSGFGPMKKTEITVGIQVRFSGKKTLAVEVWCGLQKPTWTDFSNFGAVSTVGIMWFSGRFSVSTPPLKILKMYKLATVNSLQKKTHCRYSVGHLEWKISSRSCSIAYHNMHPKCAMVKSRYIGDGHPTFNDGILIMGPYKPLLLGWFFPSPNVVNLKAALIAWWRQPPTAKPVVTQKTPRHSVPVSKLWIPLNHRHTHHPPPRNSKIPSESAKPTQAMKPQRRFLSCVAAAVWPSFLHRMVQLQGNIVIKSKWTQTKGSTRLMCIYIYVHHIKYIYVYNKI